MVTSPGSPSPPSAPMPPALPQMEDVSQTLSNYLNQFSAWCRRSFSSKLDANTALNGIMLQAYDAPAGVTPNVFLLRVNQAGQFVGTPVPLGGGQP